MRSTGAAEPRLASPQQVLPLPLPHGGNTAAVKQEPAQEAVTEDRQKLDDQAFEDLERSVAQLRSITVKPEKVWSLCNMLSSQQWHLV